MSGPGTSLLQEKIESLGKANPEIKAIYVISSTGIPLALFSSHEIEEGEKTRLAATALAVGSLSQKTLATIGNDRCEFVAAKGEKANVAIAVGEKFNLMVLTQTTADSRALAKDMVELLRKDGTL